MLAIFIMLANNPESTSNDAVLQREKAPGRSLAGRQSALSLCVGKGVGGWRSGSKILIVFRKEIGGQRVPMSSDIAQTYFMSS